MRKCRTCNKRIVRAAHGNQIYCSLRCRDSYRAARPHSEIALERGLLKAVAQRLSALGLSLSQIAHIIGRTRSTVHRMLTED